MSPEPRHESDYSDRQVDAARRVLVDVGQVLAAFRDAMVVVGGWVPDLLFPTANPKHVGSIDVDLALDAVKLGDGRYAELLKLLLDTGRYNNGDKKNHLKLVEGFRVLQFPACAAAFEHPESIEFEGQMISGATNTVRFQVASLPDFIIMKAHAVAGRDKPKDVYDLCYCLDEYPDAIRVVAEDWRSRHEDLLVATSMEILREKFQTVDHYGPQQLAIFHDSTDDAERAMQVLGSTGRLGATRRAT